LANVCAALISLACALLKGKPLNKVAGFLGGFSMLAAQFIK
jgi:hypothetical protein